MIQTIKCVVVIKNIAQIGEDRFVGVAYTQQQAEEMGRYAKSKIFSACIVYDDKEEVLTEG